jgi:WhiB family redox-sensing transcriptional regulator
MVGVTGRRRDPAPAPRFVAPADASWREDAACQTTDPDLFFPEPSDHVTAAKAIAVCETCPVTDACLRDALVTGDEYGIRGGLTPQHRAELRADRQHGIHRRHAPTPDRTRRQRITLT